MACSDFRDELSARLDGEEPLLDDEVLDAHLDGCQDCAMFAAHGVVLHRTARVRAAEAVPDLQREILERIEPLAPRPAHDRTAAAISWTRTALTILGLTMIVLSIPALVLHTSGSALHMSRELGAWDAAFGAGLLFAAWQPSRARGLLPMAGALAGFMVLAALIDIATGRSGAGGESHHLLEIGGVVVLWFLAHLVSPRAHGPRRTPTIPTRTAMPGAA